MRILSFLFLASVTVFGCQTEREPEPADRPNVVLIIGDDYGFPYHSFMGADYVKAPTMERLAASGTVFTHGYVPANHCSPSLRSMITGLLPIQYDALQAANKEAFMASEEYRSMPPDEQATWQADYRFHSMKDVPTLARVLSANGYQTWQGGKWWEFNYQNGGFDYGMTTGWTPEDRGNNEWFLLFMGGAGRDLARVSNQAAYDFIDLAGDDPFFMWYAPELPHYPFDAPQNYLDIYADADMSDTAKLYFANVSWFDERLGEFLDYLEAKGKLENTLVIYINDNGWEQDPEQEFMGDPLRFNNGGDKGKLGMTDLSFRTPVIFSWPGRIDSGSRLTSLIHAADIPPTVLDFLDIEGLDGIFGTSYKEVLKNQSGEPRSEIVGRATQLRSEDDMMGRKAKVYWIRQDEWFLNWDTETGEKQLFNVQNDPREDTNVASQHPERVDALTARIESWRTTYDG
ncbi:MAG: sulfatase-like hydrolase/transferase [Rhodothermaceae bacterium]|nr:sulfatase-like hydrolase/transferase [Rhodothermaceae bacterium]